MKKTCFIFSLLIPAQRERSRCLNSREHFLGLCGIGARAEKNVLFIIFHTSELVRNPLKRLQTLCFFPLELGTIYQKHLFYLDILLSKATRNLNGMTLNEYL